MTESDDRLAPVTYLPGVARPDVDSSRGPRRIGNHPAGSGLAHSTDASAGPGERNPVQLPTLRSVFGGAESTGRDEGEDDRAEDDEPAWGVPLDGDGAASDERPTSRRAAPESDDEAPVPAHKVEAMSMRALGRRGLSRRELERTLRQRGVDEDAISTEVARLEGVGLLDDTALAQHLVGTLQERKGLARSGIAAELTRRLLAPAAIEYALDLIDSGDELAKAKELAAHRARQLRSLDRETAARRLSAWLARRGYGGSTVRAAVDHALGAPKAGATVRFR